MEAFIKAHNPAQKWDEDLQAELVDKFEECLKNEDWPSLEALAVASRQEVWRTPLANDRISVRLLDEYLWSRSKNDKSMDARALAIRLVANCSIVSEDVQGNLAHHVDDVRQLLGIGGLTVVTIGLIANMIYADNSSVETKELLQAGLHEEIVNQIERQTITLDNPLFDTALEILETLSEDDLEAGIPNAPSTRQTTNHISNIILREVNLEQASFETLVRILLRWVSKRELRSTSKDLGWVYEAFVQRELRNVSENDDQGSLLDPFESILGEQASELATSTDTSLVNDISEPAIDWIHRISRAPNETEIKLCATGYLILCNLCTESFAIRAVRDLKLHEPAISTLRNPTQRASMEIRTNAAAFLANLCQPTSNREQLLSTNIVRDLFYDAADVEPELPIKMMRRLVSGGYAVTATAATSDHGTSLPNFKHVIEQLPDQEALQDAMAEQGAGGETLGMPPPSKPGEQLTKDIAHIFVDLRRHSTGVTSLITPKLIWALVNLVLLGVHSRNAFDTSEGVFGLGLALQGKEHDVDRFALETIQAMKRNRGLDVWKQVMISRSREENSIAQKVAENAGSVLLRLKEVAERKGLSMDLIEEFDDALNSDARADP